jgi:hypothetical protein
MTGATITSAGAASVTLQGSFYFRGVVIGGATGATIGPTAVGSTQNWFYFDNCSLRITTSGNVQLGVSNAATWATFILDNTTVRVALVAGSLAVTQAQLLWRNTGQVLASGSAVPTALISIGTLGTATLEGLDLSQAQSRKIVTTANTQWLRPYQAQPLAAWNATTGSSKTVTVYGTINSASLPNNDDIWLEVSGLTNASFPVGSVATTTKSNVLATAAAAASDSSTWVNIPVATWDTSTAVNVALSGGNLTATTTGTSAGQGVRAADIFGRDNGKLYYELTVTNSASSNNGVGVGTTISTYANMISSATTGAIVFFFSGNIWAGGSNTGISLGARSNGDVIGVAIDLDNRTIWFKKVNGTPGNWNNSGSANPATNAGGITVPAGLMVPFNVHGATAGSILTANFGASGFTGTVPSGFVSGWLFTSAPFKLVATLTPQMAGYLIAQVKVARASTTYYIDPLAVVT